MSIILELRERFPYVSFERESEDGRRFRVWHPAGISLAIDCEKYHNKAAAVDEVVQFVHDVECAMEEYTLDWKGGNK